jgi:hypothetical protein
MDNHVDLLVDGDSIVLDAIGVPVLISGRASIAQDLKNMIRETGYLIEMIGERSNEKVTRNMVRIETKVEEDLRIKPGTAKVTRTDNNTFFVTATTIEYGDVEFYL